MSTHFSDDELTTLRRHRIVLYAQRVIFDAQPPMPAEQITAIQAQCAGPIPQALVALWQHTAGGRLDYDLTLSMNGNAEAVRWSELFYNGRDGYRDLQGWIDHERELANDARAGAAAATLAAGTSAPQRQRGALVALPFGGFEHTDRIYAVCEPGPTHGQILAWKQGLPPAWTHALHEDGLSPIALDLPAAFAALHLDEDPLTASDDYVTSQSLIAYLDDRHQAHGLELALMDRLIAFYALAVLDWRTPLTDGTLRHQPALAHTALHHAIRADDAELIAELAAAGVAGVAFGDPLQGSAIATDVALRHGAFAAAAALVRAGAPVAADALRNIDGAISPELTSALLANGAEPDVAAIVQCVACGAPASARLIAQACARAGIDVAPAFAADCAAALTELEASLLQVRDAKLAHYLGAEGLAERIAHLRSFVL